VCQEQSALPSLLKLEKYGHESAREFAQIVSGAHQKRKFFTSPGHNLDSSPEIRPRSQNSILSDFRERMKVIKGENLKVKERPNLFTVRAVNKIPISLKYFDTYNMNTLFTQQQNYDSDEDRSQAASNERKNSNAKESPANETEMMSLVEYVLGELENMRTKEKQRLIKKCILKDVSSQEKGAFLRVFIFLFGRPEAEENYYSLLKEKRVYNQRAHNKEMPSKNASAKLYALPPRKITLLSEFSEKKDSNLISKERKLPELKSALQSPKNFDFGGVSTNRNGEYDSFSLSTRIRTLD